MEKRFKTCCFTGHRPERLPWLEDPDDVRREALVQAVWGLILQSYLDGYTRFLTGMARGVDLLCGELVLRLREEHPEVELVPVIPYPGQARRWPARDRARYRDLFGAGTEAIVIRPAYERSCYRLRNQYLVDHAARLIGVYDGTSRGGTYQTLEMAKERQLEMHLIYPG